MENGSIPPKTEGLVSRMALNDNKAGMEGLDRDKINKIIMESSKGSKFYENEVKREQQVNQRIDKMMLQKEQITEQHLKKAQAQVARMVVELEKRRDLTRVIVHVDMDAFYAAVEMRDCPELKDKPMAVGSMSMLSTSNYHARKYGVRAAMPGFIAKKLCPNLVIVPTNFDKYRAVSSEIREIFADYDPNFMPMSLDEAYLDFTEHLEKRQSWPDSLRTHHYRASSNPKGDENNELPQETTPDVTDLSPVLFDDSPSSFLCCEDAGSAFEIFGTSVEEAVREMRFRIEQKTLLTASAGIAPNMMLAKVCSDKNKPNGQYRLPSTREAVMEFVCNLPVRKVSGIGKVSEKLLNALGISSCSHLGQKMALLSLLFSETAWHHFLQVSLGLGSAFIPRHEERKSMSTERTFKEMSAAEEQLSLCRELCEDLANDLKKEGLKGKTVTLKLKNVNFEVKTRALTLSYPVATADEIFAVAKDLLKTERDNESPQPLRLRLMGVRISAFVSSDEKQPLQKSIVGFLNPGKAELGPSHKEIPRESEEKTTLEEPQQSFFQKARAKRLQLQAAAASSRQEDSSGISSPLFLDARNCAASDEPDNDGACGASTSTSDGIGLSCPVCFRRVETADLAVFNRHIDQCLSESSAQKPSQHLEEGDGREAKRAELSAEERSLGSTSAETASSVNGNHSKSSSLVCPICLLTQDSDDLILFNRHVDLCLNQGVLHKLQSETRSPINPPSLDRCSKTNPENVAPRKFVKGSCITIDHFFR
uniref:DNA polymerase kappa n=1 Tax=Takifugu rubripes TaxID=31033 RepID=A0A674PB39_TAKRU